MNANMKRLLIFALVPITVWGIGSTFTKQKIDRIGVNTESQITMEDTTRFSSGTASTVPYLDANKDLVSSSVTPTELGYLSGVSSSIQTQINSKQDPVSGTANEIDFASDIIGLADNPILPGLESVTLPAGADGDRPVSPVNGMIRYNTTSSSFEGYQAGAWGELGGGGGGVGGSRLQLISGPSFEEGVTEGSCTGCTATQDTTDKLGTDNNLASLKMAFSASSGDYTLTKSTSAQYSNVAGTVSAWIKTSASDCHFDELVDGTQSQTVAIGSSDEWKQYIINGTTGTTSYGWRVRCDTAITDDVFVDETFAGAAEPDVFDIGTASFYGSVKWDATTNCNWARGSTTLGAFSSDADCDDNARTVKGEYNSTSGDAGNSDGQLPQIKFSYIPAGVLRCESKAMHYNTVGAAWTYWAFSDGTTTTSPNTFGDGSASLDGSATVVVGEFHYTTPQTSETTIQIYSAGDTAAGSQIIASTTNRELEISCYHYPSPQKVVAAKCDGLSCINEFSARMASDGSITSENVDFISGNCSEGSTGVYTCTYVSSLFGVEPAVGCTIDQTSSFADRTCTTNSGSTSSFVIKTVNSAGSPESNAAHIFVSRQGSDYKQFDQRFIPVEDEFNTEWADYAPTLVGFGSTTNNNFKFRRVGDSMEIQGYFTTGTTTATEAQVPLPNGHVIDSSKVSTIALVGNLMIDSQSSQYQRTVLATGGDSFLNFGLYNNTTANGLNPQNGSTLITLSGITVSFYAKVPIVGWTTGKTAFIGNLTPKEFVQTPGSTKPVLVSALVTSMTTVTEEDDDFLNGNCSTAGTGDSTCTFTSSYWSSIPMCWVQTTGEIAATRVTRNGTTDINIDFQNTASAAVDDTFMLFCKGQKN